MRTVNGLPAHVLLVHAIVVAGAAVYDVVGIGDSGAKASWSGWAQGS